VTTTHPGSAGSIVSPALRATTVAAIALISIFAFEALAVGTAMPVAAEELGGIELYALAFGAPLAAGVLGMVAAGPWSDRRGPGPAMWWGLSGFSGGVLVAGLAPSMAVLVLGRTLQGAGAGATIVALYVLVARCYPEALHPRIFAAFATAWVVPSLVGPPVAGLVADHVGWRWVFLAVPLGVLPAVVLLRPTLGRLTRPDTADAAAGRAPIAWAACAAVSAGALHVAGHRPDAAGLALLLASLTGLTLALPHLVPAGTFSAARGLPAVIALRGLFAAGFFSAEVFIPLMLTRERGLSPALAGAALTIGALSWAVGSNLQARVIRPEQRTLLLRCSAVSIAIAVVCAAVTAVLPVPTALAVAGWTLAGLGMGAAYPTLSLLSLQLAEPGRQGAASSGLQISDSMTSSIALAVSGAVFAALIGSAPETAYLAGFAIALAFLVTAVLVAPRAAR
jgi:MFS family permease